ncbi:MAG: type II toxin-antitoxin system RelE/ParE family toxin [Bacteroidaceae bacterium]|nr:type II toxin-antitoxin system RelE/ParE family toxin [Bacteroidaceae bacterium]
MKIIWHPRAEKEKDKIADYIRWRFGDKHTEEFMQEVDETAQMLMHSPNIGTIDPLYAHRARTYRSIIINGLSKMVYYIDHDTIRIAAFWDTRREPKKQAKQTE